MKIMKFLLALRGFGIAITIAGELLVKAGSILLLPNLGKGGLDPSLDQRDDKLQDLPTHGVKDEKPEREVQLDIFGEEIVRDDENSTPALHHRE
jgi:hypothetical protein